jgi:hypothetical protein
MQKTTVYKVLISNSRNISRQFRFLEWPTQLELTDAIDLYVAGFRELLAESQSDGRDSLNHQIELFGQLREIVFLANWSNEPITGNTFVKIAGTTIGDIAVTHEVALKRDDTYNAINPWAVLEPTSTRPVALGQGAGVATRDWGSGRGRSNLNPGGKTMSKSTGYKVTITSVVFYDLDSKTFHLSYAPTPRDVIALLQAEKVQASTDGEHDEDDLELFDRLSEIVKHGPKRLEYKDGQETKHPVVIAGVDIGDIRVESFTIHSRKRA